MEKVTALLVFISAVLVTKPSPWRQTVSVYEWKKVGEGILCILLRAETVTGCHAPQQSDPPETKIKEGLSWLFEIYLIHFFLASMQELAVTAGVVFFFFNIYYVLSSWENSPSVGHECNLLIQGQTAWLIFITTCLFDFFNINWFQGCKTLDTFCWFMFKYFISFKQIMSLTTRCIQTDIKNTTTEGQQMFLY